MLRTWTSFTSTTSEERGPLDSQSDGTCGRDSIESNEESTFWIKCLDNDNKENSEQDRLSSHSSIFKKKPFPSLSKGATTVVALTEKDENNHTPSISMENLEFHRLQPVKECDEEAENQSESSSSRRSTISKAVGCLNQNVEVKPPTSHSEGFEWAYEIWREMGLMHPKTKKGGRKEPVTKPVLPAIFNPSTCTNTRIVEAVNTERQASCITGETSHQPIRTKKNTSKRERFSLPIASKEPISIDEPDSFASILNQWRSKSDDKPNAHFLSPDQLTKSSKGRCLEAESSGKDEKSNSQSKSAEAASRQGRQMEQRETEAENIKKQYIRQGMKGRSRSCGRSATNRHQSTSDESRLGFHRSRTPLKSRGDFKKAVKDVLNGDRAIEGIASISSSEEEIKAKTTHTIIDLVDHVDFPGSDKVLKECRSKSVPRSFRDKALAFHQTPSEEEHGRECHVHVQASNLPFGESRPLPNGRCGIGPQARSQDYMIFNGDDAMSIPSHVEINTDDCSHSIAESRLTDARAGFDDCSESSPRYGAAPAQVADSPWTKRVVSQLEGINSNFVEISAGLEHRSDERPWRRDTLAKRVDNMIEQPNNSESGKCMCAKTVFSDKDELIDFFLPLMGTGCSCGKVGPGLRKPGEPTSLHNILRPWQVDFLGGFGIYRGDQLVKAHHRSAGAMAIALRQYRKEKKLTPFRTKSCAMALQIWSKTCKAFVRSIRKQLTTGTAEELKVPNTLYILSSFLEGLPVDGIASSDSSVASSSVGWSVTKARTPPFVRKKGSN